MGYTMDGNLNSSIEILVKSPNLNVYKENLQVYMEYL